ncbi:GNAT family N-acetyltransferase [Verrucosispora sp. WMMD573]|uniref:GNAT family N-acetyltransferase n=1 Tax=Verrucosispora sp. WMMD573 TaxID=3015149 RepID=UPI00248CC02F|nr:GNAT family N-acetyltransferase [Verrucosispora sp. WMMD573]WBB57256.1 GNAT family N-acetyltransferase [Verrucosispora sp. WMMD573]
MPTPTLRTERLLLEPYRRTDRDDFVALFTDVEVGRFMGDGPLAPAAAEALFERVFSKVYANDLFDVWAVRSACRFVGHAEIKPTDEVSGHEIVYALAKPAWGGGLGTELVRELLRYGFDCLGLSRIHATVDEQNSASLALLARLGFGHERDVAESNGSITRVLLVDQSSD